MLTKGLLVRLKARSGKTEEVESFLRSALPLVQQEPGTTAWFAVRFGMHEYGIIDMFPGDADRQAHLEGAVAKALMGKADELLEKPPEIRPLDILAEKLPKGGEVGDTKSILLRFKPRAHHEQEVEQFLRGAEAFVEKEEKTTAWFAIRTSEGEYGIFDVFPDNAGRFAHLTGQVPLELVKHARSLLGSVPNIEFPGVLAEKVAGRSVSAPELK